VPDRISNGIWWETCTIGSVASGNWFKKKRVRDNGEAFSHNMQVAAKMSEETIHDVKGAMNDVTIEITTEAFIDNSLEPLATESPCIRSAVDTLLMMGRCGVEIRQI
jgi:hypothetical protein